MQEAKFQISRDGGLHKPILIADPIDLPAKSVNPTEFFKVNFISSDRDDVQDPSRKPPQGLCVQCLCRGLKKKVHEGSEELPINCLNLRSIKANLTFDCLASTRARKLADFDAITSSGQQTRKDCRLPQARHPSIS